MRVAILEWICSSYRGFPHEIELVGDGATMLQTLLESSLASGRQAGTLVSDHRRLLPNLERLQDASGNPNSVEVQWLDVRKLPGADDFDSKVFEDALVDRWTAFAADFDCALVVAPEIDGLLERVIERVGQSCRLLNVTGAALALCCDKLALASWLSRHGIAHPHTWKIADFESRWSQGLSDCDLVLKPRRGAGCHQVQRFAPNQWREVRTQVSDNLEADFLVQEYVTGEAFSLSMIFSPANNSDGSFVLAETLPLCRQNICIGSSGHFELSGVDCVGGPANANQARQLRQLVQSLTAQLPHQLAGWVGLDLLYSSELERWVVVELNPRCTASIGPHFRSSPARVARLFGQM